MHRLTLICLLVALGLVFATPASGATLKSIWGPLQLPNGAPAGPTYRSLGVDDLQQGLPWSAVAPTRPANARSPSDPGYRWPTAIDDALRAGRRYGFSVSVVLQYAPPWANGGHEPIWAPTNPRDFADFAYAASKRYPSVRRWMIWGEPSRSVQFQPLKKNDPSAPRRYARLVDAAYGTLKRANKRNTIIGGMSFTAGDVTPKDWVRWMRLPNGKPPRLSYYGHNPFSTRIPDLSDEPFTNGNYDFSDLDTLYRQLRTTYRRAYPQFRERGPKIWISEFTIQADHGSQDFNFYVSSATQGRWIRAAYREANSVSYVAGVGWLGLLDEPKAPFNRTTGLLTYELQKKPSYFAYKRAE